MNTFITSTPIKYVITRSPVTEITHMIVALPGWGQARGDVMENQPASLDATNEQIEKQPGTTPWASLNARLAVENQSGPIARQSEATLVRLELAAFRTDDSSKEPIREMTFSVSPVQNIVVHGGELGTAAQKLAVGGQIRKTGDLIQVAFPNDDKIAVNLKTGDVAVESYDRYQKEVHFQGTPWQKTILTSENDTRVTVGPQNISSIERGGMMEVFPRSYSRLVGAEPRLPASEELNRKLSEADRDDLREELGKIDRAESAARKATPGDAKDESLAEAIKQRGIFLEKTAQALPDDAVNLDACAENQLRTALKNMRDKFGSGTPEAKSFAEALLKLLASKDNSNQQDEVERLNFEIKRSNLLEKVIDYIKESPGETYQTMDRDRSQKIRASLISIHIAGGDNALKDFVADVNRRIESARLVAPVGEGGPFHHGAIILTPEGATSYNGSFNLVPRNED